MGRTLFAAVVAAAVASPVQAQRREWQVHGTGVVTGSTFTGGGVGFGYRTRGRVRLAAAVAGGEARGALAGRVEAALSYHVNPFRRGGVAAYAGGGLAATLTADSSREYLVVLVGIEAAPGGRTGWFLEGGLAGGLRLAAGWRVRSGPRGR